MDVVVCSFGVPHFADPEGFFREAARVLRSGGRLAFSLWAPPDRAPVYAALFGALAQHGRMNVGLPEGPNFFRYGDPGTVADGLTVAGFTDVTTALVPQTWEARTADDVFESLLRGTVRTGSLLMRQPPEALARVRASFRDGLAGYVDGDVVRVPMPAMVVTAARGP